jgi:hypothetical protein
VTGLGLVDVEGSDEDGRLAAMNSPNDS